MSESIWLFIFVIAIVISIIHSNRLEKQRKRSLTSVASQLNAKFYLKPSNEHLK